MANLNELASLLARRNMIAEQITALIGRPAQIGHLGEYIASEVFGIDLMESAVNKGFDGRFRDGALAGKTVNIKWYGKNEGMLDIRPDGVPDYYLVMTGPKSATPSSRGQRRLWLIEYVFLFESKRLLDVLTQRGVKLGEATSVIRKLWAEAEIYPSGRSDCLTVTDEQESQLRMFGADEQSV